MSAATAANSVLPGARRSPLGDRVLISTLATAGILTIAILTLVVGFLAIESWPLLSRVGPLAFFTGGSWHPTSAEYDLSPMLAGTALAALGAIGLAAPLGVLSAIFVRFHAPAPIARVLRRVLELLAGIPSVVYGFWGLVVLVPWIVQLAPPGPSLLAAILVLALMILPTVAIFADAALGSVSPDVLRGAAALGLSRTTTALRVALPAARSGVTTGVLLATARAIGETMAVLMVAGNVVQIPGSVFDPVRTLTANIALEMSYAMGDHRGALFVGGLVLMLAVGVLLLLATLPGRSAR